MAEMKVATAVQVNQIGDSSSVVGTAKGVRVFKDVRTVLVEYEDKDGSKYTKLAVIIGNQEVRFFVETSLSGEAQSWLADRILTAVGITPPKRNG